LAFDADEASEPEPPPAGGGGGVIFGRSWTRLRHCLVRRYEPASGEPARLRVLPCPAMAEADGPVCGLRLSGGAPRTHAGGLGEGEPARAAARCPQPQPRRGTGGGRRRSTGGGGDRRDEGLRAGRLGG
jgi:hypothetical protein